MKDLRIAFAGTPSFAAIALDAIVKGGYSVGLVLTQPDRRAGRGMKLVQSAVKEFALANDLPLDQPVRLGTELERSRLIAYAPDVLVVAAYGLLLPAEVLALPRYGCINIHASLLPRWRGAAPIHRAIESGDSETGITIMQMDAGLDTGPILLQKSLPIAAEATLGSLYETLAVLGADCILEFLGKLVREQIHPRAQPEEGVTYASKVSRDEAQVDWSKPALELERKIRAFNPFPGTVFRYGTTEIKIWKASIVREHGHPGEILAAGEQGIVVACGQDALQLTELQKAGSRRMDAIDFLRGFPLSPGDLLQLR